MWLYWFFIPAIKSMRLSFYNYSYITPERTEFVGFDKDIFTYGDRVYYRYFFQELVGKKKKYIKVS